MQEYPRRPADSSIAPRVSLLSQSWAAARLLEAWDDRGRVDFEGTVKGVPQMRQYPRRPANSSFALNAFLQSGFEHQNLMVTYPPLARDLPESSNHQHQLMNVSTPVQKSTEIRQDISARQILFHSEKYGCTEM